MKAGPARLPGRRVALGALLGLPWFAAAAPASRAVPSTEEIAAKVLPAAGHLSRVALADSIVKLAQAGVIDRGKLQALYSRGAAPAELPELLDRPQSEPMRLTTHNARLYVNLLWPLGLANRMDSNSASPLNGPGGGGYASTGGWTLGRAADGSAYFNTLAVVRLTARQEALVTAIAQRTFRPCCNNSTFFQDCNHGSALLGLLALGASQGVGEGDLYREALAFNAFWFPGHYLQLALYFQLTQGLDWRDVDPRRALGPAYSSAGGMQANVLRELQRRGLLPARAGADCSA